MRKILIIITTGFVPYGGLTTVVMNYYRAINKKDLLIDIASTNEAPEILLSELHVNNSHYYNLGNRKNLFSYLHKLISILQKGYDVIHVNGNSATMLLELQTAKIIGIPTRIAHVHTTKTQFPIINSLVYPLFKKSYTKAVAVSRDAGDWLYGSDYIILNNAIEIRKYVYSENIRKMIRKEYGLDESIFIIGNVGKLNTQKNHEFLIKVFSKIRVKVQNSKLMIVGGGELEKNLKIQQKELELENDIIFTGMVDDTSDFYQAFDFFAFPSRFEGLGLALIEAQASGLRCIISDKVPKEAIVTDQVEIMSIEGNYDDWAEYILSNAIYDRAMNSKEAEISIHEHGFDIYHEAKSLELLYENNKVR